MFRISVEKSSSEIILLVACFLIGFDNLAFFSNVTDVYPVTAKNILFLLSLIPIFASVIVLLLSLACYRHTIKPVLITVLIASSFASYFMDSYNIVIDDSMINNIVNTDAAESRDLLSFKLVLYVVLLGIIPSIFIYRAKIINAGFRKEAISRIKLVVITLIVMLSLIVIQGNFYASFFREHKSLRYYANPSYSIYSAYTFVKGKTNIIKQSLAAIGQDAHRSYKDTERELIIFVLGETGRADRFSLNGYERETNPSLKNKNVASFSNFWACDTSTATAVPCIFSLYNHDEYSVAKANKSENLLDLLQHAGVNVLWLDNNSDSKGVALRVPYKSYKTPDVNPVCDVECRDEGMLTEVQSYIDEHKEGDIFIVLHQMGNHGPAYYKRYPKDFEHFTPVCNTNQLEDCNQDEINNAYDNAILYTDYFLSKTIELLEKNNDQFEPAMFYVSDHGESLGENGLYLHGMPSFIAPDVQLHVPAIMWVGKVDEIQQSDLNAKINNKYTHDNIFHTVLGFMEIETSIYNKDLDIIHTN